MSPRTHYEAGEKTAAMIFRNKMRQRRQEAFLWVVRLMPGNATVDDLEKFKRWSALSPLHVQAFVEARRLWNEAKIAGRNVEARTAFPVPFSRPCDSNFRIGRRVFLGGMAAAAASYVVVRPPLGLWPSLPDLLDADYRTGIGEQRHLKLADTVSIEMNTRTSIALRPRDGKTDRIELMSGEGVITTEARAFEVVSGAGRAWASDATFNVRRNDGVSKITCLDGVVHVACGGNAASLAKGQQVSYTDQEMGGIAVVDPVALTSWRTGFLVFHDTPLREVIAEINRYRQGRIIVVNKALGSRVVNARFRLDRIDDAVENVTNAFGATATPLPGGVIVVS